jgi:transcriptional antiterminator NusG
VTRIARAEMTDTFGDILVPTEEVIEMRAGRSASPSASSSRLRAGADRDQRRRRHPAHRRRELAPDQGNPKVMGFIGGTADKPLPIKDEEADAILQRVQDGVEKPRPKVLFEPGQMVRVVDGPFNDFNGVVEEVNYDKSRVRVAVLIFGRSTPVELEFGQVEKA